MDRSTLLSHFCFKHSLKRVALSHPTYHHFVGDGLFDSEIDVLLFNGPEEVHEDLVKIICKLESPIINSQHDAILSSFSLPCVSVTPPDEDLVVAPRISNERVKIDWSEDGIEKFEHLVGNTLADLREQWGDPSSSSSISILLASTYSCLSFAAASTNKAIVLGKHRVAKPFVCPRVRLTERDVHHARKKLDTAKISSSSDSTQSVDLAKEHLRAAKAIYRQTVRAETSTQRLHKGENLFAVISSNPSAAFRSIKSSSRAAVQPIQNLKVKDKLYSGENVPDGFYDSLSSLKAPDLSELHSTSHYQENLVDYENVLKIARNGLKMPAISPKHSTEIIHSLKANVNDFYSITAAHFINAGFEGLKHFHYLLNIIIDNVNLASLEELNTIWACILHKGHGKDKESDRSYRTISTCPLLAKALDCYAGELYGGGWAEAQAEVQFQGPGSSHELAGLLLTEVINFSLFTLKQPLFLLLNDAMSAFDLILRENVIVEAFKAGTVDQGLLYLDSRLGSRHTFCEWNKELMGPIRDLLGAEQGGINSDRLYKLVNNSQFKVAQQSRLGVTMGSMVISSVGQADDSGLMANTIFNLQNLLLLTLEYCKKYSVTLVPAKTKLLAFCPPGCEMEVEYAKIVSPINIDGISIPFSESAEHVGIVRSVHGNMPNILARLSAHRRAVFSLLSAGLAKGHWGNPAACVRVERLFGIPVLLSGLATMVLSTPELAIITGHFKKHMERLLKLHSATPECVIWFLSGCLPVQALLHLRQISLFGMITRLYDGNNVLASHARHVYATAKPSSKSWFLQLQNIFLQYSLPHPITFLDNPPTKHSFKRLSKSAVMDHWEQKLRAQADMLSSLTYFNPAFMSLSSTHPLYSSCGSSPYQVSKACVQACYLSGRARVEALSRHWDMDNKDGSCLLCKSVKPTLGNLEHFLLSGGCPALVEARLTMLSFFQAYMVSRPYLLPVLKACWDVDDTTTMQFLLDCSVLPIVIKFSQEAKNNIQEDLFYMTRSYIFKVHLTRRRLLENIKAAPY